MAVMCEYIPNVRTPGVTYIVVESTEDCVGEVATQFYMVTHLGNFSLLA